jgi:hypothetical protein
MKLVDNSTLRNIIHAAVMVLCVLFALLLFILSFSVESNGVGVAMFVIALLFTASVIFIAIEGPFEYDYLAEMLSRCGIVSEYTFFNVIERGDVICFNSSKYTGASDTPEVVASETWIVEAKGKHFIQIKILKGNEEQMLNLLPRGFTRKFKDMFCWYNQVIVHDQVIYSDISVY